MYGRWGLGAAEAAVADGRWGPGAAEAVEGDETAIAYGFPSLEEARAFMQGAGLPIIDRHR